MKKSTFIFAVCFVLIILFLYLLPVNKCDNTLCQLGEVIPFLAKVQLDIESPSKITTSLLNNLPSPLNRGYVSSKNGDIILVFNSGVLLISSKNINAEWVCSIYPEKLMKNEIIKDCGKILR